MSTFDEFETAGNGANTLDAHSYSGRPFFGTR